MATNPNAPGSIRLVHGMEHAGLSDAALQVEQSRAFKRAFGATISGELGFADAPAELVPEGEPSPHLAEFLEDFGPEGHPSPGGLVRFLEAELALRAAGSRPGVGQQLRSCCIKWPPGWLNCDGYVLTRDGRAWTVEAAVVAYESAQGPIADEKVRAELAAIRVYVQLEWDIPL